jgi:glucose/arabinose dehydrogenase
MGPPGQAPGVGDGALLYVVIGDLNRDGQLENFASGAAPDDTSVILRVRQDGTPAPGNPFTPYCSGATTQTCSEDAACGGDGPCVLPVAKYFAYGVRNSFGMALDPLNGRLWNTENGQDNFDEVNRVAPGFNSGWERIMGPASEDPEGTSDLWHMPGAGSTYSDPEFSWSLTISPTAIVLPFGSSLGAAYDDTLLVGSFNTGQLFALQLNASRSGFNFTGLPDLADRVADNNLERDQLLLGSGFGGSFSGITDLKFGPSGALFVVSIGGSVYRIDGPGAPQVPALSSGALAALGILLALAAGGVLSSTRSS